jgi:hypothetical protein
MPNVKAPSWGTSGILIALSELCFPHLKNGAIMILFRDWPGFLELHLRRKSVILG